MPLAQNRFVNLYRNPYCILTLLCLAVYAPFSNKAFHIDSPVTVYVTQQLLVNPINPPLGRFGALLAPWNHTALPSTSVYYITPHPPLIQFYLLPFMALFGASEHALNWAMFPFYLFSVLIFFKLATVMIARWRFEATLLFLLCPVVLVNGQNVMLDLPLGAFCMAAFYCLFRSDRLRDAAWAGFFASLACLTKFTGGTVVISAFCFFTLTRSWKRLAVFLIPFALLYGAWTLHNAIVLGKIALISNGHAHYVIGDLRYRLERLVSYFGGTIAFPLFPLAFGLIIKKYRAVTNVSFVLASVWSAALIVHLHYSMYAAGFYALCAASGLVLILIVLQSAIPSTPRSVALAAHFILQIVGGLFLTLYASRYMLPMVFLGVFACVQLIDRLPEAVPRRLVWGIVIAVSALVSIALSRSDYQLVDAERRIAVDVRETFPRDRIWFSGRLGYLYYMDKAGCMSLTVPHDSIRSGDLLVKNCAFPEDAEFFTPGSNLTLIAERRYPLSPFLTMTGRAGFYGNDRLPYAFVFGSSERLFQIFRRD
jgi:hypothetical protein